MRSPEDIASDLELDRASRDGEIRLLEMYLRRATDDAEKKALRRCIVVVGYSHFEGFCKFALTAYLSAVNSFGIQSEAAAIPLAAAAMTDIFDALRNDSRKSDLFRASLANDADVHRLARQQEFVASYEAALSRRVVAISDRVVDAKSNLNAVILKRNLFVLGLSLDFVEEHRREIDSLLHIRNSIAHGDTLMDPKPDQLDRFQKSMGAIMSKVHEEVVAALIAKRYLRAG